MSDVKMDAAFDVASKLRALEAAINDTALLGAELPVVMLKAAIVIGTGPLEGQRALDEVAGAFSALVQARQHVARAHHRLSELAGIHPEVAFGDQFDCDTLVKGSAVSGTVLRLAS